MWSTSLDILFGALVEGDDSKGGTTASETLGNSLVVFNCGTALARGGDDNMGTACQETFEDLYAKWSLPDTSDKGVLRLECRPGHCNFVYDIKVHTRWVRAVLLLDTHISEIKERDPVSRYGGNAGNLRP